MAQVNVNIDELKKMASMIANEQAKIQANNIGKQNLSSHARPTQKVPQGPQRAIPKHPPVQVPAPQAINSSEDIANILPVNSDDNSGGTVNTNIQVAGSDDMLGILGFTIPKQTLYFILILIVIAVGIWYMSRDTKYKKKRRHDDEE